MPQIQMPYLDPVLYNIGRDSTTVLYQLHGVSSLAYGQYRIRKLVYYTHHVNHSGGYDTSSNTTRVSLMKMKLEQPRNREIKPEREETLPKLGTCKFYINAPKNYHFY